MNLTLKEFGKLVDLYRDNSLSNEDLIYQNVIVPMSAIIQAVSILEDTAYEFGEKKYLIKGIYDTLVDPVPVSMEEQIMSDAISDAIEDKKK